MIIFKMIESLGDDVLIALFSFIILLIIILSWYSTQVRELPANLLIIERRFRRVYRHSECFLAFCQISHYNLFKIANNQTQLIATAQQRYTNLENSNSSVVTSTTNDEIGEAVEQALVDEILDGEDSSLLASEEVLTEQASQLSPSTTTTTPSTASAINSSEIK